MSSGPDNSKAAEISAKGTEKAALINQETTREQMALQEKMFGMSQEQLKQQEDYNRGLTVKNQGNYQPYVDSGQRALQELQNQLYDKNSLLNKQFNMEEDDGVRFRREQGNAGLNAGFAAKGNTLSGAAAKAAMEYNQKLASDEYNNAYARYTNDQNNTYNRLNNMVNTGLAGNSGYAGASTQSNLGNNMANLATGYGNSVSGILGQSGENAANLQLANAQQQAQYALGSGGGFNAGNAMSGAAMGAKAGSAIMPGWGTAIGAVGGALMGFL